MDPDKSRDFICFSLDSGSAGTNLGDNNRTPTTDKIPSNFTNPARMGRRMQSSTCQLKHGIRSLGKIQKGRAKPWVEEIGVPHHDNIEWWEVILCIVGSQ